MTQPTTKTMLLSLAASAVLDAYKMLHPEFDKRDIGNDAILKTVLPQLPRGITVELAKRHIEIKQLIQNK